MQELHKYCCVVLSCCSPLFPPKDAVKVVERKKESCAVSSPWGCIIVTAHMSWTAPNCCLPASIHPPPVTFVKICSRMHLHQHPPSFKNSRGYDWFWVASLAQPKPLLLRGSECVTQDNTVLCESESGRLCFGMYGGVKEWDVLCNLCLVFPFLLSSYPTKGWTHQSFCPVSSVQGGGNTYRLYLIYRNQIFQFSALQYLPPSQGSRCVFQM